LILVLAAGIFASNVFIDWRGKFKVSYPDSWRLVPYEDVDDFLLSLGIDPEFFDADAALAETTDTLFEAGKYVLITLEEVGELNNRQIDSSLKEFAQTSGKSGVVRKAIFDQGYNLPEGQPVYDASYKTAAVMATFGTPNGKEVLFDFRKYYNQGVAAFFCHAPHSDAPGAYDEIYEIIKSFSIEDLHEAAPASDVQIVDLSEREEPDTESDAADGEISGSEDSNMGSILIAVIAVVILAAAIVVFVVKKQ